METIGSILKEAREKQNKSIDDIVEATKISRANIAAIESENFDFCPGHAYTRAFIKIYAEEVHLDSRKLAVMYDQKMPEKKRFDNKVKPVIELEWIFFLRDNKAVLAAIMGFVAVLIFVFSYINYDVGKINQDIFMEPISKPETNAEIKDENEDLVHKGSTDVSEFSTIKRDDIYEEGLVSEKEEVLEENPLLLY